MTIRSDHVAGAAFVVFGIVVFAMSTDLPFGSLSSPGAGMMPKLMAGLMIAFALVIMIDASGSQEFSAIDWSDRWHALLVVIITACATALYQELGFIITMSLLIFTMLVVVERKNVLRAAAYSVGLTLFAYWLFGVALKSPLERGVLWF
jgi:hypothetical protein